MIRRKLPGGVSPTLTTNRLRLVAPARRHAKDLYAYGTSRKFTAFLDSAPFRSEADADRFLQGLRTDNRIGKRMYWVAEDIAGNRAVGTLGLLFPFSPRHRVAEFGYGFAPDTWGTGLFTEAAEAVTAYGFRTLGLRRIQATTRASNARSIKGVQKIGFRKEARLASFYSEAGGRRSDAVVLALLAPTKRGRLR